MTRSAVQPDPSREQQPLMKNFLRALRYSWPYRGRILIATLCALAAAFLWGANFTSLYPVLKMLHTRQSLHQWVEGAIADLSKETARLQDEVDQLAVQQKAVEALGPGRHEDQRKRDITGSLARKETKLASARHRLYWLQVARKYIVAFLPDEAFSAMACIVGVMLAGFVLKCIFELIQESLVGSIVNSTVRDIRNAFFRRAIHYDIGQFREKGTTELMARFTNDMEAAGVGMKVLFGKIVAEPLRIVSCVVLACFISWQLTLMFLILVPVAVLVLHRISRVMKKATRRVLEQMSSLYKILQEAFQGIRAVKLFTMEARERRRFADATRDYHDRATRVAFIEAFCDPIIEILGLTAVALALLAGSYLVLTGRTHLFGLQLTSGPMEPETLLQLYILLAATADPVRKLSNVFTRLQSAFAASDRVFSALDMVPKVTANAHGPALEPPCPASMRPYIEFRDVCFSYEPGQSTLSNINLAVRAGEVIALVGPNGCGKSTLVGLLPRFHDPDHGSVLIGGQDLRKVNLRSLRREVCLVTQGAILFDDTVYNNIAYGSRGATPEMVERAARMAMAHEFIMGLPDGYQTLIGEMRKVSGGEEQRIALARAFLRSPSILVLDEFTSNADPEKDLDIHRALQDFKQGRTLFIITHRLNTLAIADRIVVLDAGRIVAVGTHAELMATCAIYQRLHEAHSQRLVA
jgi:ATP-binding cassette subfamily B protein/subfamily B ATP-binding cassette protein MsbA